MKKTEKPYNPEYYTPTIEEFHVGFEFESDYILFHNGNKLKANSWSKIILTEDADWLWESYKHDAVPTEFRVKHLDREDIESLLIPLGFKHEESYSSTEIKMIRGSIWSKAVTISMYKGVVSIKEFKFTGDERSPNNCWNVFAGKIKNKSELKRILTQTGVI